MAIQNLTPISESNTSIVGDAQTRLGNILDRRLTITHPTSIDEIKALLKYAGQNNIQLLPTSHLTDITYRIHDPSVLVLALDRMNKILEVNESLSYAVVEPGVTYEKLIDYLNINHPNLWCDCYPAQMNQTIMHDALESHKYLAEFYAQVSGIEMILPNGKLIQTGGGALNNCHTFHTYKYGIGPFIEPLCKGTRLGVVTKLGIWLKPKPESIQNFHFHLGQNKNLINVLNTMRPVLLDSFFKLDYSKNNNTQWQLSGKFFGRTEKVRYLKNKLNSLLRPFGTLNFGPSEAGTIKVPPISNFDVLAPNIGNDIVTVLKKAQTTAKRFHTECQTKISMINGRTAVVGLHVSEKAHAILKDWYVENGFLPTDHTDPDSEYLLDHVKSALNSKDVFV